LDGYPSGYYDVLIELYDDDEEIWVAEYGPNDDQDLAVLPLEDSYRDGDDYDDHYDGGGGALDLLMILSGLGALLFRNRSLFPSVL
jgi:hypothetical protein